MAGKVPGSNPSGNVGTVANEKYNMETGLHELFVMAYLAMASVVMGSVDMAY